jgi:hypothetical protein
MKKLSVVIIVALFFCLYFSCTKDKTKSAAPPDCTGVIDSVNNYHDTISYILNNYCAYSPCHDAGTASLGVNLSTYSTTVDAFKNKNLLCSVQWSGCIQMPYQMRQLDSTYIKYMVCWAANGYPQ